MCAFLHNPSRAISFSNEILTKNTFSQLKKHHNINILLFHCFSNAEQRVGTRFAVFFTGFKQLSRIFYSPPLLLAIP